MADKASLPHGFEFIPDHECAWGPLDVAHWSIPEGARSRSDFVARVRTPADELLVLFADVTDPALVGRELTVTICHSLQESPSLAGAMAAADATIPNGRFGLLVLLRIPRGSDEIELSLAGVTPLLRDGRRQTTQLVGDVEFPLWFGSSTGRTSFFVELPPLGALVLSSKGLEQALDPRFNLYGVSRLLHLVSTGPATARELGSWIRRDFEEFLGSKTNGEDATLVCITGRPPS